uniref:Uncharacterized protein n=1 Tax=Geospiza parvula TaxID=87175 RepID=A0A8U8B257_GEOPR
MGESPALPPGHAPWQPASPIIPALRHGQSLGEFSAGRRNSQCINMQKRCINCFMGFRKLQHLNNIISLLNSQYCAARTYFSELQIIVIVLKM